MSVRLLLAVAAVFTALPALADPASPAQSAAGAPDTQAAQRRADRARPGMTLTPAQKRRQLEAPGAALMMIPASTDGDSAGGFLPL